MKKLMVCICLSLMVIFVSGSISFAAMTKSGSWEGRNLSGKSSLFKSEKFRQMIEKMKLRMKFNKSRIKPAK